MKVNDDGLQALGSCHHALRSTLHTLWIHRTRTRQYTYALGTEMFRDIIQRTRQYTYTLESPLTYRPWGVDYYDNCNCCDYCDYCDCRCWGVACTPWGAYYMSLLQVLGSSIEIL